MGEPTQRIAENHHRAWLRKRPRGRQAGHLLIGDHFGEEHPLTQETRRRRDIGQRYPQQDS